MLALFGQAFVCLLLTVADASWVVAGPVRVWRRREAGMTTNWLSVRHRPLAVAAIVG
jgi:hypothetical protein